jgi:hypothetical protein
MRHPRRDQHAGGRRHIHFDQLGDELGRGAEAEVGEAHEQASLDRRDEVPVEVVPVHAAEDVRPARDDVPLDDVGLADPAEPAELDQGASVVPDRRGTNHPDPSDPRALDDGRTRPRLRGHRGINQPADRDNLQGLA